MKRDPYASQKKSGVVGAIEAILRTRKNPKKMFDSFELFGIEHREGWNQITKPLFEVIKLYNRPEWTQRVNRFVGLHITRYKWLPFRQNISVQQVKEKFGTLRFYCCAPDWFQALVDHAETESEHTCEDCGRKGRLRDGGWVLTLCPRCAKLDGRKLTKWEKQVLAEHPEYEDATKLESHQLDYWYWDARSLEMREIRKLSYDEDDI